MDPGVDKNRDLCPPPLFVEKENICNENGIFMQHKKSKLDAKCIMICFLSRGR
jgi:hypothetical protein